MKTETDLKRDIPLGILFLVISAYCIFAISQYLGILHEPMKMFLMIFSINIYNMLFNKGIKQLFPLEEDKNDE